MSKTPSEAKLTRHPLPQSRKIYVEGKQPGVRVAMREIRLSPTQARSGVEENPPLVVYDSSRPYTDPSFIPDLERRLPPMRDAWTRARQDVDPVAGKSRVLRARGEARVTQMH